MQCGKETCESSPMYHHLVVTLVYNPLFSDAFPLHNNQIAFVFLLDSEDDISKRFPLMKTYEQTDIARTTYFTGYDG